MCGLGMHVCVRQSCVFVCKSQVNVNHDHRVMTAFPTTMLTCHDTTQTHIHTHVWPCGHQRIFYNGNYPLSACMRILQEYMNNKCNDMRA